MRYFVLITLIVLVLLSLAYGVDSQGPVITIDGPLLADEYFITLAENRRTNKGLPSIRAKVDHLGNVTIMDQSDDCEFWGYRGIGQIEEAWVERCGKGIFLIYRNQRYQPIGRLNSIDPHDFYIDPVQGHIYLMIYDRTENGPWGFILQKQSLDHQLLFEWESDDYISNNEAQIPEFRDRDYAHINSIDVLYPLILISLRHTNAIIAINEETGDIEWQIGGIRNTFTPMRSDIPLQFPCMQHTARFVNAQHDVITAFDNGNHCRPYSRGVTYELDTEKMVISQTQETIASPMIFSLAAGSYDKSHNSHLFSWGFHRRLDTSFASEIRDDGTVTKFKSNDKDYVSYQIWRRFNTIHSQIYLPIIER